MNLQQLAQEIVELVKIDRAGREHRESMPRWLAEIAIGSIPAEEPEVAFAWIAPIEIDRQTPYPARRVTYRQIWRAAFALAGYLPFRSAD